MKMLKALLILVIAVLISVVFGYYYKKPDAMMLSIASAQNTEWKKDLLIASLRSKTEFFELQALNTIVGNDGKQYHTSSGNFLFNWFAFTISLIGVLLTYIVITKTTILDWLRKIIKPYLK